MAGQDREGKEIMTKLDDECDWDCEDSLGGRYSDCGYSFSWEKRGNEACARFFSKISYFFKELGDKIYCLFYGNEQDMGGLR